MHCRGQGLAVRGRKERNPSWFDHGPRMEERETTKEVRRIDVSCSKLGSLQAGERANANYIGFRSCCWWAYCTCESLFNAAIASSIEESPESETEKMVANSLSLSSGNTRSVFLTALRPRADRINSGPPFGGVSSVSLTIRFFTPANVSSIHCGEIPHWTRNLTTHVHHTPAGQMRARLRRTFSLPCPNCWVNPVCPEIGSAPC